MDASSLFSIAGLLFDFVSIGLIVFLSSVIAILLNYTPSLSCSPLSRSKHVKMIQGDQASIIGGVVEYIKELQQVLQSLEAKKQRKVYSEVLSPRPVSSPRPSPLSPRPPPPSPRPPPPSPRISLPISPRTPQPGSPYKPRVQQSYLSPSISPSLEPSAVLDGATDLSANSRSPVANVEVKFLGPNVLLKTVSPRISGQALKIVTVLERLALEILQVDINTVDDTMLNSFTIKVDLCLPLCLPLSLSPLSLWNACIFYVFLGSFYSLVVSFSISLLLVSLSYKSCSFVVDKRSK